MISSYKAAQLHMEKAQSKAKGRPMKSAGWRLFQDGDEYVVTVYKVQVGRFLPDNTFMFSLSGRTAYPIAQTLSGTMSRNLPFQWARVASKVYRVDYTTDIPHHRSWDHFQQPTNAPMVYDGLKFDLFTGKCLNYRPDHKRTADPERRKEWLAASQAWKRKLKVLARIGVLDEIVAAERANPTPYQHKPRWNHDEWLDKLYKAIKDNDCSTDILRLFAASEVSTFFNNTGAAFYKAIDKVIRNRSVELRRRFGVFKGDVDDKFRF